MRVARLIEMVEPDWHDADLEVLASAGGTEVGHWLTATFEGYVSDPDAGMHEEAEGLSLDEALAWARERAERVSLRLGDRRHEYSAGAVPITGLRPWPPADLEPVVRRREPAQRWKDRASDADPIAWDVQVHLTLSDEAVLSPGRPIDDGPVAALARRTGAVSWDREPLDAHLADLRAAAGDMWTSTHMPGWRVWFRLDASTRDAAAAAALAAVGEPPGGLRVSAVARPAPDPSAAARWADGQRAAFDAFAAEHAYAAGSGLDAALDALLLTEARPDIRGLTAFVGRHGVELGDNHLATVRSQWLPVLDEGDGRALLVEVDEDGLVESIAVVRTDLWTRL